MSLIAGRRSIRLSGLLLAGTFAAAACTAHHPVASSSPSATGSVVAPTREVQTPLPATSAPASVAPASLIPTPGGPAPAGSAAPETVSSSATAFVRAYFAALNESLTSHSYAVVQNYFHATCRLCETTVDGLKQLTFEQQTLRGGSLVVTSVGPVTAGAAGSVTVITVTSEEAGEIVGANGGVASSFKALPPTKIAYTLQPNGSSWVIVDSAQVS